MQTGVLRAAFMQRPDAELYGLQGGYLRLPACCLGVSSCLVGSVVEPIVAFSLGLLNARQPFAMPFKAPTSIRIAQSLAAGSDKSLASMRGQLVKATKVLRSLVTQTQTLTLTPTPTLALTPTPTLTPTLTPIKDDGTAHFEFTAQAETDIKGPWGAQHADLTLTLTQTLTPTLTLP